MPKSRNRSRDIRKRAAKKRANKERLERRMLEDRIKTAELHKEAELLANCNKAPSDLATYPIEVVKVYENELHK
jgi:hypothetical protein